ncbi:hypothetical protein HYDPIDRAFT_115046 [Hydnomerulius pinastri MD-312]|uniref:Unplaced genomic scaffold scaffold_23, whole genome shotgun sequence n=1 Tax=Hydnomerulius pinastri MD-312 TaxID=994086 RepID=A0A0C9VVQ1_9AGAM|nr:hypothetical protein HYDPIDRAFT_115046 [Hydnomerulius pinastri MD-312]
MLMICLPSRSPSIGPITLSRIASHVCACGVTLRLVYSSAYGMASKLKKPEKNLKEGGVGALHTAFFIMRHVRYPPRSGQLFD